MQTNKTFFNHFIFSPFDDDLSSKEQWNAFITSLVIGILSLGTIHAGIAFYQYCLKDRASLISSSHNTSVSKISGTSSRQIKTSLPEVHPEVLKLAKKMKDPGLYRLFTDANYDFKDASIDLGVENELTAFPNINDRDFLNKINQKYPQLNTFRDKYKKTFNRDVKAYPTTNDERNAEFLEVGKSTRFSNSDMPRIIPLIKTNPWLRNVLVDALSYGIHQNLNEIKKYSSG